MNPKGEGTIGSSFSFLLGENLIQMNFIPKFITKIIINMKAKVVAPLAIKRYEKLKDIPSKTIISIKCFDI